jgi:hypothetical protein
MKSITHGEGYLLLDHRAGAALPDEYVHLAGLPVGAGRGVFEAATISCEHCGTSFYKNPARLRPRGHCRKCDRYICDPCEAAMSATNYTHRTFEELANLVQSGRYTLTGTTSAPVLTPMNSGDIDGPSILSGS